MAPLSSTAATPVFIFFSVCVLLVCPAISLNCTSQKFANKLFANCSDLPNLSSYLHYTYNATNSSLSVAFVAAPANPDGWISWGINPTAEGMPGTQALIAYKSKGAMVVKTYNLASYSNVTESKLSFDVWDLSAQDVGGEMTIFASVKVPEKVEEVNQVWQVGPSVSADGKPAKHELAPDNLGAKSSLALTAAQSGSSGNGTTAGGGAGSTNSTGSGGENSKSGGDATKMGVGLLLSSLAILVGSLFVA